MFGRWNRVRHAGRGGSMSWYTDDPVSDFNSHDAEQERWLQSRPLCCVCKEHIQEAKAVYFDGEYYCSAYECDAKAWEVIRKYHLENVSND